MQHVRYDLLLTLLIVSSYHVSSWTPRLCRKHIRHISFNETEGKNRDDLEYVSVLASLPAGQTVFEYLIGCWKRINSAKSALSKKVRDIIVG